MLLSSPRVTVGRVRHLTLRAAHTRPRWLCIGAIVRPCSAVVPAARQMAPRNSRTRRNP